MTPADRSTLRDHLAALMGDLDAGHLLDAKATAREMLGYIGRDESAARHASETARVACPAPTILYPAPIEGRVPSGPSAEEPKPEGPIDGYMRWLIGAGKAKDARRDGRGVRDDHRSGRRDEA